MIVDLAMRSCWKAIEDLGQSPGHACPMLRIYPFYLDNFRIRTNGLINIILTVTNSYEHDNNILS